MFDSTTITAIFAIDYERVLDFIALVSSFLIAELLNMGAAFGSALLLKVSVDSAMKI